MLLSIYILLLRIKKSLTISLVALLDILKQVWDLSDQDSDSMLSLREFCFALYLMERFREGRTLPPSLPNNVMHDETLLSMTGPPKVAYGGAAWGSNPGIGLYKSIVSFFVLKR